MAPLPRWSNSILWVALLILAGFLFGVPAVLMAWVRTPVSDGVGVRIEQPVQFDHRHHAQDAAIRCLYCHYDAERGPTAGVPDTALCMGCHGQVWNDSPQTEPLRESWSERRPIAWRRVTDLPDFVFFDHSVHVRRGVGCESCHGRVDRMAAVYRAYSLDMGFCLDCHRDPEPHLRPPEHADWMGYPMARARGRSVAVSLAIDPPTHCTGCHR
ncbi:MAG: cytochrome c family protein [Sandaracinaceae bacterium]|nr:cytochrome c family protein [Sandaracinaceae bacterium]